MHKRLIAGALFATTLLGAGYTVGQLRGPTPSSAASSVATPAATQTAPDNGAPGAGRQDTPHADGTVTAINGDTVTISAGTDPSGTTEYTGVTTVVLSASTQFDAGRDSSAAASKSSVKVGSYIIVDGALSSDGKSITASHVGINAGGPVPGR